MHTFTQHYGDPIFFSRAICNETAVPNSRLDSKVEWSTVLFLRRKNVAKTSSSGVSKDWGKGLSIEFRHLPHSNILAAMVTTDLEHLK